MVNVIPFHEHRYDCGCGRCRRKREDRANEFKQPLWGRKTEKQNTIWEWIKNLIIQTIKICKGM